MEEALEELISQAQQGDRRALNALLQRYQQDVTRIAFRLLGPDADLEDVVQEAFVQLFRSIRSFKGQSKFSTWLYRVVSNVAKMHLRARRVRPRLAAIEAQERPRIHPEQLAPDDDADRCERVRAFYARLAELGEKKRTVLILHDLEGLSPAEIADIVEAPVMTVRTRLFYARKALYAALADDPHFEGLRLVKRALDGRSRS